MASVHFWTVAPESFIAPTFCGVEAIKLSGHVIIYFKIILKNKYIFHFIRIYLK